MTDPTIDPVRRIAWLLATTRLFSEVGASISRAEFIERMRAEGIVLDPSRVSLWETGTRPAGPRVIAGYEAVLECAPGSLQAVAALLQRSATHRRAGRAGPVGAAAPPPGADQVSLLDGVFERIEHRTADGGDWLRLAADLAGFQRIYLHPSTWSTVSGQLISELTRSTGVGFVCRYEAAAVLMGRAESRRHLSRSIGRFVMHPDAQHTAPALTLLREVADGAASDLVLRLTGGDDPDLRRAAMGVAGALMARGHITSEGRAALEAIAAKELRSTVYDTRRIEVLEVVAHLTDSAYRHLLTSVEDARLRGYVESVRATRELVGPEVASRCVEHVATAIETQTASGHDPDQMLRRALREALFHVGTERRDLAGALISVSAYARRAVPAVLELTEEGGLVAAMAWALLRRLGGHLSREKAAHRALAEPNLGVRAEGLMTVGHCHGLLEPAVAERMVANATNDDPRLRHSTIFALGMMGQPHLDRLINEHTGTSRQAALWWRAIGPSLHDE